MARLQTLALLAAASVASGQPASEIAGDGLIGWRPDRHAASWTVAGGVLHAANDPGREGSILWTERSYRDALVELEFRFGAGTVDSGVFLRDEREQIQIGESGSLQRDMTCSPYIAGVGYPIEASGVAELLRPGDWNTLKIVAVGPRYDVWLNGAHVMNHTSDSAAESGPIGLQLHPGRTMSIDFRNVRVTALRP